MCGLKISGLDRDLPSSLGLLPVDRLSSFVPFGLRLMLQRLTEGPKRPHVCCSQTPFQFGPKPTKTLSIISVVRSRSRGRKLHLIWTLLAPSTYIYVQPFQIRGRNPKNSFPRAAGRVPAARTCPHRRPRRIRRRHVAISLLPPRRPHGAQIGRASCRERV